MRDRWRSTGPRQLQIRGLGSSRAKNGTRDPERRFLNGALMAKHLETGIVNPVQLSLKTLFRSGRTDPRALPAKRQGAPSRSRAATRQKALNLAPGPVGRHEWTLASRLTFDRFLWRCLRCGRLVESPPDVSRRCGVPGQESLMSCGTDRFHVKRKHYGELVETVGGQEG